VNRSTVSALAGLVWLAGAACSAVEQTEPPAQTTHTATLTGQSERPTPVISTAQGTATVIIKEATSTMTFSITVSGLTDVTMAHIHVGGTNDVGPSVANLLLVPPAAGPFSGVLVQGLLQATDIIGGETYATLVTKIRNGEAYINVHTTGNPDGAIRGQL
jgi:hypothetical protein